MHNTLEYFHHACNNVVKAQHEPSVNWAVGYATVGLTITRLPEAKIQAAYILSNITHWRGLIANETRNVLKNFLLQRREDD